jgi:hypothetical protein
MLHTAATTATRATAAIAPARANRPARLPKRSLSRELTSLETWTLAGSFHGGPFVGTWRRNTASEAFLLRFGITKRAIEAPATGHALELALSAHWLEVDPGT